VSLPERQVRSLLRFERISDVHFTLKTQRAIVLDLPIPSSSHNEIYLRMSRQPCSTLIRTCGLFDRSVQNQCRNWQPVTNERIT